MKYFGMANAHAPLALPQGINASWFFLCYLSQISPYQNRVQFSTLQEWQGIAICCRISLMIRQCYYKPEWNCQKEVVHSLWRPCLSAPVSYARNWYWKLLYPYIVWRDKTWRPTLKTKLLYPCIVWLEKTWQAYPDLHKWAETRHWTWSIKFPGSYGRKESVKDHHNSRQPF